MHSDVHATRIQRTGDLLSSQGVDLLVVGPGSDMSYLVGYLGHPSERPALLLVRKDGAAGIVMAAFESRSLPELPGGMPVLTYTETENPFALVQRLAGAGNGSAGSIAIGDQLWGSVVLRLQGTFPDATLSSASTQLRELRMRKDAQELELLCSAAERTDSALDEVLRQGLEGKTESQLSHRLCVTMQERGLSEPWAIVASGPNGASPHHRSADRVLRAGECVVIDMGGVLNGYHSDVTRTVCIGPCSSEVEEVYETVKAAQEAGVETAGPGIRCEDVDRAARRVIEAGGFAEAFIHRTGHGIGLDTHEDPYLIEGNLLHLEAGMTHSVEPGIYLEGRLGVRIEDIVAITDGGSRRLNQFSRDLLVLG